MVTADHNCIRYDHMRSERVMVIRNNYGHGQLTEDSIVVSADTVMIILTIAVSHFSCVHNSVRHPIATVATVMVTATV